MGYGYHGKLLQVDLSNKQMKVETPDDLFYRKYTGGAIMSLVKLLQDTEAGIDALAPDACIAFSTGIVSGFDAPGLARFTVIGKSPATGGIGEARCEGTFAAALKRSGFDGIFIRGACQSPSILLIDNGVPEIIEMPELWGQTVRQGTKVLMDRYDNPSIAIIGPAGEKLVRFANIIADRNHQASRAGMGAVMGSKRLKAVVIVGGSLPQVYSQASIAKTRQWFETELNSNTLSKWQRDRPGFGAWIHTHGIDAAVCVNNYQTSQCDYLDAYEPEQFEKYYIGEAPCPSCPNQCIKSYAVDKAEGIIGGIHQEALGALGPNLGNSDLEKVIQTNVLCNDFGLDPDSLGYTISFAQECVQRGVLSVPGIDLSFSAALELEKITTLIAYREGIGDLLAEGAWRAAKIIGKNAEQYAMTVKGNEMTPIEGRSQTNLALGFATAAVGPKYDVCEHDWDFDINFGWDHSLKYSRTIGIVERVSMQLLSPRKVKNYKALNNLWSAVEALGMCIFASAPTRIYSLDRIAALYHDITGFEVSSYEVMRLGEMKNHLFRLYNYREGFGPEDDTLPERFFESAIDAGALKGSKLDKKAFEEVIQCYYQTMGWDHRGCPTKAVLYDFGLDWINL